MKTVTLTVRLSPEIKERLEALAKATDRTQAYLAGQAVEQFIELHQWQVDAIKEGLEQADAGDFATEKDVHSAFAKWGVRTDH